MRNLAPSALLVALLLPHPIASLAQSAPSPTVRYNYGDNPLWANPNFDDSSWPIAKDGILLLPPFSSSGMVWIRVKVDVPSVPAPLAIRQVNPQAAPSAEELYVNGALIGGNGSLPPHPVAETALTRSVYPLPHGLVQPGATAVVALRGWERPLARSGVMIGARHGEESLPISFEIDRVPVLTVAGRYERQKALVAQAPNFVLQSFLVFLGIGLLIGWRLFGSRDLALFGTFLIAESVFVLTLAFTSAGLFGMRRQAWDLLYSPQQFIGPVLRLEVVWLVLALPGRTWKNFALACLGIRLIGLVVPIWAVQASPSISLLASAGFWAFRGFELILMCALAWHLVFRRTNRLLAIALGLPTLANNIPLPPLRLGGFSIGAFYLAMTISGFAVAAMLMEHAWKAWTASNNLRVEFAAARELQQRLVPVVLPMLRNGTLAAAYIPAAEVGGDFYQVWEEPDGATLLVVGDVSGKGLKAAMTGVLAIGALRTLAAESLFPAALLQRLNAQLCTTQDGGFITCVCAHLSANGVLTLANAGHLAPYRNGEEILVDSSLPLGIAPDAIYSESTLHLAPGDTLTFLSDGVVEAQSPTGELFGFDRTAAISNQPAEAIANAAQQFGQEDDITVLTLRYAPA